MSYQCFLPLFNFEQITLVRNRIQHPEHITSISIYHSKNDLTKYPNPYFVQNSEPILDAETEGASWLLSPTISPTKKKIESAISNVEKLCSWLESEYWKTINT